MTGEEALDKIGWEGGVQGALEYGIRHEDIDEGPVREAWKSIEEWYAKRPTEAFRLIEEF